jgi:hypothetical protein
VELSGGAAWLMKLLSASIGAILVGNKKFLFQRDAPICGAFAASFIFRRRFQCETTADCVQIPRTDGVRGGGKSGFDDLGVRPKLRATNSG